MLAVEACASIAGILEKDDVEQLVVPTLNAATKVGYLTLTLAGTKVGYLLVPPPLHWLVGGEMHWAFSFASAL